MKKIFFTLLLVGAFAQFANAQALQFVLNGTALADNEVVTITEYVEDPFGVYLKFAPVIKNNSSEDMSIKIIKNEVEMPGGEAYSTFCTEMGCFPGEESPVSFDLAAGGENTAFYGQFFPTGASSAIIKYTAEQTNGSQASCTAEVHYKYDPSGIEDVGFTQFAILQGSGICRILYSNHQDVQLDIYSITGSKLGNYVLPASSNSFDLPTTNHKGLAILVFTDKNGKKAAEKVIIK